MRAIEHITCPWCEHGHSEWYNLRRDGDTLEMDCKRCEKRFLAVASITYTTTKIEPEGKPDASD